ncbi:MAG: 3-phosphoshikimate 1-carboxyvinyltransferase [Acholeplasmataceae bacterium]|nr:3-phosphoshikimate 1-carboxyvinyltransferase [Acholeplasmataceae bacterium]
MNVTIKPTFLSGEVQMISSKSLSHRYLIAAGLSRGTSQIDHVLDSEDITATKKALEALNVSFKGNQVIGGNLKIIHQKIDANASGSTLRFMIPIFLLMNKKVFITGHGKLVSRPLDIYENIFSKKKVFYQRLGNDHLPIEIQGPLKSGYYPLPGNVSSQFITGLMFALPLLKGDSVIEMTTPLESSGYVDITMDVLQKFGIHILNVNQAYYINGSQIYQPQNIKIEGDYSQAAFFLVAGTIGKQLELTNLNPTSKQGDQYIIDIINQMGGDVSFDHLKEVLVVKPKQTHGIEINLSQIPDLGPVLMVLAALSEGVTTFRHIERLRIKESDRLQAMLETLIKFGVEMTIENDCAIIKGQKKLKGNQIFDCFSDHRIAMAIAIAAIRADGNVTILNAEAVKKSYPDFFNVYQSLGGMIYES